MSYVNIQALSWISSSASCPQSPSPLSALVTQVAMLELSTHPSEPAVIASAAPAVDTQTAARAARIARRETILIDSIKTMYEQTQSGRKRLTGRKRGREQAALEAQFMAGPFFPTTKQGLLLVSRIFTSGTPSSSSAGARPLRRLCAIRPDRRWPIALEILQHLLKPSGPNLTVTSMAKLTTAQNATR